VADTFDETALLESYFERLWPLMRSLTGEGARRTHEILGELVPLESIEVASGTACLDWEVPKEWVFREAYVIDPDGRKILDASQQTLHLVNCSAPFRGQVSRAELDAHLHSSPERPDVIPYRTSYYHPTWGFCLTHREREALPDGDYQVVVDTDLVDGSIRLSENVIAGATDDEVLISTYTCHPSMANDNLSGPLLTAMLQRRVAGWNERRLTYRFVWLPETIGAVAYLARLGTHFREHLVAGYVASCLGDPAPFTYKRSRRGSTVADRAALHVLRARQGEAVRVLDFEPTGSDERQYCSPGYDLPVGVIARSIYGRYDQYHTSADDRSFLSFPALVETIDAYEDTLRLLDRNRTYQRTDPRGEPQLGKRGLYPTLGAGRDQGAEMSGLQWVLNLSDGDHDLLSITERSGLPFDIVADAAEKCHEAGLLV
jgi:aminopeptidase-like protein